MLPFAHPFLPDEPEHHATFRCARCGFVVATRATAEIHHDLFPCPLCGRRRSRLVLALRCLGTCFTLVVPFTLVATIVVFFALLSLGGQARFGLATPFWITGAVVALALALVCGTKWRRAHREAERAELCRFREWRVPAGPRILAAQDPGSGDEAVWIDGVRAPRAAEEDRYRIALAPDDGEAPYRRGSAELMLVFAADGASSLTLGGAPIEPVRASSDVV